MQLAHLEADPLMILDRERCYELHKQKLSAIEKQIDNSSPCTIKLTRYVSKSPIPSVSLKESNLRIFHKLNKIYSRPLLPPKTLISIRTSPFLNRQKQAIKIANDNEVLAAKIINKKSTLSRREFKIAYKESEEYKEMISKSARLRQTKGLLKKFTK